ncbi:MAG: hypothetical protein RBS99_13410 [Rhodospirillales bacterium]|nr:hypothetical protein [Rhodospirillales bacterium]
MTITVRLCPACCCDQPMKRFRNKTVTLTYEGEAVARNSHAAYAQAGDELVERSREKIGKKPPR